MKTFTVAEILNHVVNPAIGHLIYLVRDGKCVFYVGQSKRDVVVRFREHMQEPSRLGRLIQLNQPLSLNWTVEFYTLADCRPFILQKSLFHMQEWEHFDMDMAESAMIQAMRPVVNQDFNPNPTPLPPKYYGHALLGMQEPFSRPQANRVNRVWLNKMSLQGWVVGQDEESGKIIWQHPSGVSLSEVEMASYQQTGQLPPLNRN